MVIDDVVIEVSKHRGIGRMYLTNFRWTNALQCWDCPEIKIDYEKLIQLKPNFDVIIFFCRLVILCHLSGLTAAGYTYVSVEIISVIYNNYCKYLKKKQFFETIGCKKNCQQIFAFPLITSS